MKNNIHKEIEKNCNVSYEVDTFKLNNFKKEFNCIIRVFKNSRGEKIKDINNCKLISFFEKILYELREFKEESEKKQA
jgi:hypothetical protein